MMPLPMMFWPIWRTARFTFFNPFPLVDDDLELVAPDECWIDDVLAACHHPLTAELDAEHAGMTRHQLQRFVDKNPQGHEIPTNGERSPSYHFWMHLRDLSEAEASAPAHDEGRALTLPLQKYSDPAVRMAGSISLRIGRTHDLERYFGHVGYNVFPPARGHHYAERACRLLVPLARMHGLNPLWITTDPENLPSRRTCERLGATMIKIVTVPVGHTLHQRGQRRKCRYRLEI